MLTIEIDTPTNGNLMFAPVGALVRGRFVATRVKHEECGRIHTQLAPTGIIPGQRIVLDAAKGVGMILEPLRDREHRGLMLKLLALVQDNPHPRVYDPDATPDGRDEPEDAEEAARLSDGLPRARQVFRLTPSEHDTHPAETWAYWMSRAVKAGAATLVSGTFADAYPHARRNFSGPRGVDPRDVALKTMADQLALLTKIVVAGLTPAQKKAFDELTKAS